MLLLLLVMPSYNNYYFFRSTKTRGSTLVGGGGGIVSIVINSELLIVLCRLLFTITGGWLLVTGVTAAVEVPGNGSSGLWDMWQWQRSSVAGRCCFCGSLIATNYWV